MTNADIFCKVLSEVTGRPERVFRSILAQLPDRGKLDLPSHDAPAVLARLRKERSGILNWVIEGRLECSGSGISH